jgi:hypothetical protein
MFDCELHQAMEPIDSLVALIGEINAAMKESTQSVLFAASDLAISLKFLRRCRIPQPQMSNQYSHCQHNTTCGSN